MTSEGRKALLFLGGAVVVVGALALVAARLLGFAAGPQAAVLAALDASERSGLRVPIAGSAPPLVSTRLAWERIVVDVEAGGERALVRATLDLDGRLGESEVHSLGYERVPFERSGDGWRPSGSPAPVLGAVVSALERRRRAVEVGDLDALSRLSAALDGGRSVEADRRLRSVLAVSGRRYRVTAWYIRSERGEVVVTEDFHLLGHTPDGPVDERGSRRLSLVPSAGEFLFSAGLM